MTVEEAVNTYGMKFEFNLVKYEVGKNKTHDSKYLDPTKISSGKAIACAVKDNEVKVFLCRASRAAYLLSVDIRWFRY